MQQHSCHVFTHHTRRKHCKRISRSLCHHIAAGSFDGPHLHVLCSQCVEITLAALKVICMWGQRPWRSRALKNQRMLITTLNANTPQRLGRKHTASRINRLPASCMGNLPPHRLYYQDLSGSQGVRRSQGHPSQNALDVRTTGHLCIAFATKQQRQHILASMDFGQLDQAQCYGISRQPTLHL